MNKTGLRHPARLAGSSFLRLQSDERLAELAIAGHDAAFDAIVVRYRPAAQPADIGAHRGHPSPPRPRPLRSKPPLLPP